ncbi:DUF3850 domain-containing protein [Mycobacterium sp. NPDC050441]|uniref:DUF3850 domain-containing protein n=1 Tax=Mycobacterium sp. NPDC050441 TaxID=3155403 RepID=UPI00341114BE
MAQTHSLKSWPQFFHAIVAGDRTHELRRNDRNFRVGDLLVLAEFDPLVEEYTGATCTAEVTSITSSDIECAVSKEALHPDFCILSVKVIATV